MKKGRFAGKIKNVLMTILILSSICLVIGATWGLPASAQGLVTGRNNIALEQLVERVGAQALTLAVTDAGIIDDTRPRPDQDDRRRGRNRDRRVRQNLDEEVDDQLERIEPDIVYQVAVDAGLLTQTEANRMLEQ